MNFAAMLAFAGEVKPKRSRGYYDKEKWKATLEQKKFEKWKGAFTALGGKAGTNALASHTGNTSCGVIKAMHDLEGRGWVRRAGVILKSGAGKNQIIWEWVG